VPAAHCVSRRKASESSNRREMKVINNKFRARPGDVEVQRKPSHDRFLMVCFPKVMQERASPQQPTDRCRRRNPRHQYKFVLWVRTGRIGSP
jgi:hypothetical protein